MNLQSCPPDRHEWGRGPQSSRALGRQQCLHSRFLRRFYFLLIGDFHTHNAPP